MEEVQSTVQVMEVTNLGMEAQDKEARRLRNQVTHCPLFLNLVLVTTAGSTVLQTGTRRILESIIVPTTITLIIIILEVTDKDPDTDLIMFTMMKETEGKFS